MTEIHHARLLLAIMRQDWDSAQALVSDGTPDPAVFLELCRQTTIPSHLHTLLSQADRWSLVGKQVADELTTIRNKVRQDNMILLARAEQSIDLLLEAGIVPVGLKGLDTLHRFYPSFDGRLLDDVDLLIRREELQPALAALRSAGWRLPSEAELVYYIRASHHLPLDSPGPIPVAFELHWNLAQGIRYTIDVPQLFARAQPLDVAGREILRLEDHDLVAHLLIHHFSHYFSRGLKWLVDMQMIIEQPGFDWNTVAIRIREWHGVAAAGISLLHLHKLWPGIIPEHALRLIPVALWRRALASPLLSRHPLDLYRHTGNRKVQLLLAAIMLENPSALPAWLRHRKTRTGLSSDNPLDQGGNGSSILDESPGRDKGND
jgi:hypothetical protein